MRTGFTRIVAALAAFLVMGGASGLATAHEGHDHGAATPAASPAVHADRLSTGVVYLAIANDGDGADRLTGASTDMAAVVEIHEMKDENGVGVMRPVKGGVEIPAGGEAMLEPSGVHLMLVGLTESLLPGTTYELTLIFERAGDVTITVPVRRDAPNGDEAQEVRAGDLTITGAWSRPAPKLDGGATPEASPASHHGH
jgi:copper(I)-binding protein